MGALPVTGYAGLDIVRDDAGLERHLGCRPFFGASAGELDAVDIVRPPGGCV